jgi:hypothetical protein
MPESIDPRLRGYAIVYRPGGANYCPGCGHSHWYVGRSSAECAFCAVALPFAEPRRYAFNKAVIAA